MEVRGHDTVGDLRKVLAARVGADPRALVVETCSASLRPELRESGAMLLDEDGVSLVDCLMRDGDLVSIAVGPSPSESVPEPAPSEPAAASCETATSTTTTTPPSSSSKNDSVVGEIVEHNVEFEDDDDDEEESDEDDEEDGVHAPLKVLGGVRAFPEAPAVRVRDAPRTSVARAGVPEPQMPMTMMRAPLAAANDVSDAERRQIEAENERRVNAMSESERADAVAEIRSVFSERALENLRMLRDKRLKLAQQQKEKQEEEDEKKEEHDHDHDYDHDHGHEMTQDEWKKIQEDNQRIVDGMSAEERQKAVADILASFSPEALEKMRQMRATAVPEQPQPQPPQKEVQKEKEESNNNPLKEWMEDAPPTEDARPVEEVPTAELRFDFAGAVVAPGTDVPVRAGLHHHGGDQWAAGYTLAELCHLSRSTFPAQRVAALTTLARILDRARTGAYGVRHSDVAAVLCDRLLLVPLLRMAVADASTNVRAAGVTALRALVVDPSEQHLRREITRLPRGDEIYSCTAGYTSRTPEEEEKEEQEAAQRDDDEDSDDDEGNSDGAEKKDDGKNKGETYLLDQFLRRKSLLALAMMVRNDDSGTPVALKQDVLDVLERFAGHSRAAAVRVARDAQVVTALFEQLRCTESYALLASVLRILCVLCKSTCEAATTVLSCSGESNDRVAAIAMRAETLLAGEPPTAQPAFFAAQEALCDLLVLARRAGVAVLDDTALAEACARLVGSADVLPRRTVFRLVTACARLVPLPPALVAAVADTALRTLARTSNNSSGTVQTLEDVEPTLEALQALWALVQAPALVSPARAGTACVAFLASPGFHALALATFRPVALDPPAFHALRCLPGLLDAGVPRGLEDGTLGAQLAAAACVALAADVLRVTAATDASVRAALDRLATVEQPGALSALAASVPMYEGTEDASTLEAPPVLRFVLRALAEERLAVVRLLAGTAVPRDAYYGAALWAVADAPPGDEDAVHAVLRATVLDAAALHALATAATEAEPDVPAVVDPADVSETMLALADHVLTPSARTRSRALATTAGTGTEEKKHSWQSLFICMDDATQHFLPLARDWPLLFLRLAGELGAAPGVARASLQLLCWLEAAPRVDYASAVGAPVWAARVLEVAALPCFPACRALVAWLLPRLVRDAPLRAAVRAFAPSRSAHPTALALAQHFVHLFDSESFGDPLMAAIIAYFLQPDDEDEDKDKDKEEQKQKQQQQPKRRWWDSEEEDVVDEIRASVWGTVPHLLHLVTPERVGACNPAFDVGALWARPAGQRTRTHRAMCAALGEGRMLRARKESVLYWAAVHALTHALFAPDTATTPFSAAAALAALPARTACDVVLLPHEVPTALITDPSGLAALTAHWHPDPARLALLPPALIQRCQAVLGEHD